MMGVAMKLAILVTGQFSESELGELLEAVRSIERRHQDIEYQVGLLDPDVGDRPILENLEMLERIYPRLEDGEPFFAFKPR